MNVCCCDPCCPSDEVLLGPSREGPYTQTTIDDNPAIVEAFGLDDGSLVMVNSVVEVCEERIARPMGCLTKCRPSIVLRRPGLYTFEFQSQAHIVPPPPDSGDPLPGPGALPVTGPILPGMVVRRKTLLGDVLDAVIHECCGDKMSFAMLAIMQDPALFGELLNLILADPVAKCVLAHGVLSADPNNSLTVGSDCGLYENDGVV